jgi:hypothetical protein
VSVNYDIPPITPRLGFTVTETVRPPEPVVPDPFILAPAAQAGGGVAANRDAPEA